MESFFDVGWMRKQVAGLCRRQLLTPDTLTALAPGITLELRRTVEVANTSIRITAGLSGFMLAPIAQASLYMGLAVGLKGFSGAMIGGLSNPRGCVIGGFILGVLEAMVNLWQAQWREVVVFALVIAVLAFRPTGLFGPRLAEKV